MAVLRLPQRLGQPRVPEGVPGDGPLAGLAPQQGADQAAGARRQGLRAGELAPGYLGEEAGVLGVVERVAADEHCVEQDADGPHVGGLAGVGATGAQDLGRHVGRAAAAVGQPVVVRVDEDRVLEALEAQLCPGIREGRELVLFRWFFRCIS